MSRRDLLIFALGVIKNECVRYYSCKGCPFDNTGLCRLKNRIPAEWDIPDSSDEEIEPIEI